MGHNKELSDKKKLIIDGISILSCPFCGGLDLKFDYKMSNGHGECSFEKARIECNDCSGAKGDGFNYGRPTKVDELKAWKQWNERY